MGRGGVKAGFLSRGVHFSGTVAHFSHRFFTAFAMGYKEPRVNIFVGNMAFSITEQDLRELFAPYGVVDRIQIITDRETGRPRGFGFVEMADDRAAQAAMTALNGKEVGGRALNVNEAKPREERSPRSGGFRDDRARGAGGGRRW